MKNLLIELFVEELPPKALKNLGEAFARTLAQSLQAQGLAGDASIATPYASPRRLALHLTDVAAQAADKPVAQKLMPASVGLTADGAASPALLKKLAALGADASVVSKLRHESDGKAEVLYYDSVAKGATLRDGLQKAIEAALGALPIPKVMSYQLADGWTTVNFVRPAHGLVVLHGAEIVPVAVLGLGAGRETHGHRFEARQDPIALADADSYARQLESEGAVIAGFAARRAEIAQQLAAAAANAGAGLKAIEDDALLDEVTALVERPNVLIGRFEEAFLEVPQECLILTMKANQKYFPLLDDDGRLSNKFLIVSNIRPADPGAVVGGNERVVRPRLADAKFFYDQDRKVKIVDRLGKLEKIVYHNKLGSQGDRTRRVVQIAREIAVALGINQDLVGQAALLAKADLVTDMVGEFPELQGIMGRYYALHDGLPSEVADAIEDHYKPRFAGDILPRGRVGVAVALADKLETLVGLFGVGQIPTGDKDPFALRRHGLGVVRILIEQKIDIPIDDLLEWSKVAFDSLLSNEVLLAQLDRFLIERLTSYLRLELNYSAQEVEATLSSEVLVWPDVVSRLEAVRAFSALPEAVSLVAANKRVGNILKKADGHVVATVDSRLLSEAAEISLNRALAEVKPAADAAFESGDYTASLQALAALKEPVDIFFNDVMVNVEDEKLRNNRLGLLAMLHQTMNRVADISRL